MLQIGCSELCDGSFHGLRNVGALENPGGYGKVGNPACGDLMEIFIRVKEERIDDIKSRKFGRQCRYRNQKCGYRDGGGETPDEANKINRKNVTDALGGLLLQETHCSNLAAGALHLAMENYLATER